MELSPSYYYSYHGKSTNPPLWQMSALTRWANSIAVSVSYGSERKRAKAYFLAGCLHPCKMRRCFCSEHKVKKNLNGSCSTGRVCWPIKLELERSCSCHILAVFSAASKATGTDNMLYWPALFPQLTIPSCVVFIICYGTPTPMPQMHSRKLASTAHEWTHNKYNK